MSKPRRARRASSPTKEANLDPQLDHLVVMRESARYDHFLMEGMIQQTLAKVSDLPEAQELMAAGMEVFTDPRKWGATIKRVGSSQLAMVERDGVLYLYSMGSAAKEDLTDTNAFISELITIIESYRPKETWVSSFTRLTRSANYVGDLMRAFSEHSHHLHCEAEIDLRVPEGKMLFQMLGMISAMERDYIVRRHTAGRVAQMRRGDWIPNAHPPGYAIEDRKIVIDPSAVESTRLMLTLLADPSRGPRETIEKIAEFGVTTPMLQRLHGESATVASARNPSGVLDTLYGWLGAYEKGSHETLWPNPFPGVDAIAGVTVEEIDGFDHGAIRLVQELPLPDGGWAEPAVFDAIRTKIRSTPMTGGASRSSVPPFSGLFRFADDDFEYALGASNANYSLLRRPLDDDRAFQGWNSELPQEGLEQIGLVSRSAWHAALATAIADGIRDGLPADLDSSLFQSTGPLPKLDAGRARARRLSSRIEEEQASLERARRNARLAEADDIAAMFISDLKHHRSEIERLEFELELLEAEIEDPVLGVSFESNTDLIAHAVARLALAERSAPTGLRDALRAILYDERWEIDGESLRFQAMLELPHEQGTVHFGPVSGSVSCKPTRQARAGSIHLRREYREELIAAGLDERPARCAAASGDPDLAAVLLAHLKGEGIPDDVGSDWAAHLISVYTDPDFSWNTDKWRLGDDVRRSVLEQLLAAGGALSVQDLDERGVNREQVRYLSRDTAAPSGQPIIRKSGRGDLLTYHLIECPHCGGSVSHSVVTPETRPGVLCTTCWRAPTDSSPVFPESYRGSADSTQKA